MTNFINDDPVNNITYMNYFNALTNGEINLYTGASSVNVPNACKVRWGNDAVAQGSTSYLIPKAPTKETKTNLVASSSNYRLIIPYISSYASYNATVGSIRYNLPAINSSNTSSQVIVSAALAAGTSNNFYGIGNSYEYAIITDDFVVTAGFASSGANLNTTSYLFSFGGWLSDSVFTDNIRTRSLCNVHIINNTIVSFRPSSENQTTRQNFLTSGLAQYPITCVTSGLTPSDTELWCTDLWLRDDPYGYAIGRVPHVLMTNNSVLNLGELVYIDSVIDGITDQKIWLVAANYGTRRLLMRVFTENIAYAA